MKIKYILYNSNDRDYIFDSEADAEEFILSETEERMYNQACLNSTSPMAWLNYQRKVWENSWLGEQFQTFEGFLYNSWYMPHGRIREAFSFED